MVNELDSTLTAFARDPETGAPDEGETVSTVPEGFDVTNYPADGRVHSSGRLVFGSNRGNDSVVGFEIDDRPTGLRVRSFESTGGAWPRHFALTRSGDCLFAENLEGDSIVPFDVDDTGGLTRWSTTVDVPEPLCTALVEGRRGGPTVVSDYRLSTGVIT